MKLLLFFIITALAATGSPLQCPSFQIVSSGSLAAPCSVGLAELLEYNYTLNGLPAQQYAFSSSPSVAFQPAVISVSTLDRIEIPGTAEEFDAILLITERVDLRFIRGFPAPGNLLSFEICLGAAFSGSSCAGELLKPGLVPFEYYTLPIRLEPSMVGVRTTETHVNISAGQGSTGTAFLLHPVPEPATLLSTVSAITLIVAVTSRTKMRS
jgi:hypothetical protein